MASPEMTALLKRNKRSVALFMKSECSKQTDQQKIKYLCDVLLNPTTKQIDDFETLDWCRWLIAGGSTFEEFAKTVRQYDNAVTCGLVWTANFVAYRCRTCGVSPCMSLCGECFHAGNHEGHDFNMFKSQAGGACDCGDVSVMNPSGFCPRHGPDRQTIQQTPPGDLMAVAEAMMPRIFMRLLYHLRDNSKPELVDTYLVAMQDAEQFLGFLHSLSDMGAAMRRVMAEALTNKSIYKTLTTVEELSDGSNKYYVTSQANYETAVQSLIFPQGFADYEDIPGLNQKLVHHTLLEELLFWTVKFEFPQKVVTLLLSLLPDQSYKEAFTRAFIQHYSRISRVLVRALDRPTVANRVVHISVQLFSNEQLACQMVKEYNLLYILIVSLNNMIEGILTESTLQDAHQNFHMVVDCTQEAMKEHCYWPIISDLINLLSHQEIAHKFMSDSKLITMWLELLSYFQGMNLNSRELHQHVEFEPETYYSAFSAELEISAGPMWSLISHCKTKETAIFTKTMIQFCLTALQDWFDAICCKVSMNPNPLQLTFHLPLHRYLATFMVQAVQHQGVDFQEVCPSERLLKCLLIHLLQIQVATSEIYCGMWVRNGLQIKGQAMTYVQCHFCYSMVDADIYLMQVCACKLDPDYFVQTVLDRFHVSDWLSYSSAGLRSYKLERDHELAMVEGALHFFTMLLSVRTYLGMDEKELTRLEMSTLLFVNDQHHSQLSEQMPEKSGMTGHGKDLFEPTLRDVADKKTPNFEPGGGPQQGTYIPKDETWETDFDPVHVLLRAVYKKDFQSAMDRYTEFVRKRGKYSGKSQPWPPFKQRGKIMDCYKAMYSILHCKTMHGFLFTVLNRVLKDASVLESIGFYAIHLLSQALITPSQWKHASRQFSGTVPDRNYKDWFPTSDIFQNVRETIQDVAVPAPHMEEQEGILTVSMESSIEEMFQLAPSAMAGSGGPITAAHSGHIPAITMVSMPTTDPNEQPNILPVHTTTSHSHTQSLPKFENRGVSTEQSRFLHIPVNESIISILLKLHSKMTGKTSSYTPISVSGHPVSDSSIGDGSHFIQQLLDRLCQQSLDCARMMKDIYHAHTPKEGASTSKKGKGSLDNEERRRKARERQQKLMADFASKQKAFMEQAMETDEEPFAGTSMADEPDTVPQEEVLYDCVICNQSTPSTAEKTVGLVVLLQASSVLGHRPQTPESRRNLPLGDKQRHRITTCSRIETKRLETLFKHFEESSCQTSVNIGWEGGVVVQTCGHYLHLDCHTSYVASLMGPNVQQNLLQVNKGEYSCPLCLQLSNSVIPILPEENKYTLMRPVSPDKQQMVKDLADMMVKRPITPRSAQVTRAMGSMMEDLSNATYGAYKTFTNSQTSESVLLFVCSVARTNLEIELLQRGADLSKPLPSTRKHSFLPLLHVLSMHSKILTTRPYTDLWSHITGVSCSEDSSSMELYKKEVPLLLKDPVSLLIQLVLTLPATIERGHFEFLVKVIYTMVYVQSLCVITCKFAEDEREAWRKKGRMVSFNTLEGMLAHVITRLATSFLYEKDSDSDIPAICQSVWSPQSVEMAVQEFCEPFLRMAALVKFHLFGDQFADRRGMTDFQYLCSYLHLNIVGGKAIPQSSFTSAANCVEWVVNEPHTLTRAWCTDLIQFVNRNPLDGKSLLMVNTMWYQPHLINLPDQYYKIFQAYQHKTCPVCSNIPKHPCICLICGVFLCFRVSCCRQQHVYECVQHSVECGAGCGIVLLVNSSTIVVIRGPRATLWGSVYLDEHGEEDRDLKRGKPLYLSEDRYKMLQSQWVSHNFDHVCKNWVWHLDKM